MASFKKKYKSILYLCRYDIRNTFYWVPKRNDYLLWELNHESENIMFQFISKHAMKRLQERFFFRWYGIEDIKNDIKHCEKRIKNKNGYTKVIGKLGTYIISSNAKVLVTVI